MRAHCVDCGTPTFGMDLRTGVERCLPCKKKHLGRKPREFTEEEVRGLVLDHIWDMIQYWFEESRRPGVREKMEGLAFSILAMLDGSAAGLPGFMVAPIPHPDDKEFSKKEIQDWYPENKAAEKAVNCDIGGSLHETFHKHRPKGLPKDESDKEERPRLISPPQLSSPLDKFVLGQMYEVASHLKETATLFAFKAWASILRYLMESTSAFHSGIFGDVKVMIWSHEPNISVTLWRDGKELVLTGPLNGFLVCQITGISGSADEVRAMAQKVIENWNADKLKRDDALGVAYEKREKDVRDLYDGKETK